MQRSVLTALCAAAALSLSTSLLHAQTEASTTPTGTPSATPAPNPAAGAGHPGGRRRGAPNGPERHAREIIAKYDKDGDHALNVTELTAFFEAMRERVEARRAQGTTSASAPTGTPAPKAGAGLAGHGSPEQHAANAIAKFDKNGDGKLDMSELTAMLATLRERALQRQGSGQGQTQSQPSSPAPAAPATTIPTAPNN
jgi:hypothetical protein